MFDWSMKPPPEKYNYYCGSCGCKYYKKPESGRCACGSGRMYRYEWATDEEK